MDDDLSQLSDEQLSAYKAQNQAVLDQHTLADPDGLSKLSDEELAGLKQRQQEHVLAPHRERVAREAAAGTAGVSEGAGAYLGRQAVGAIRAPLTTAAYAYSKSRLNNNEADEGDLRNIALYEQEQRANERQPDAVKWAGVVAGAPGQVATLGFGGPAGAALKVATIGGGAVAGAAAESGTSPFDPATILKGGATAGVQLAILKGLGPAADLLFPGAKSVVAKAGAHGLTGTASMAAADYATAAAGLTKHGGAIQDLVEGKLGDAGRNLAGNFLMTAGLGVVEAVGRGVPADEAVRQAVESVQGQAERAATSQIEPPPESGQGSSERPAGAPAAGVDPGVAEAPDNAVAPPPVSNAPPVRPLAEFPGNSERVAGLRDAMKAAESGAPATYVDMDVTNHAGMKGAADEHTANMVALVEAGLKKLSPDAKVFRHSDQDEFSAVVPGVPEADVRKAIEGIRADVADYAKQRGLADVPHTKENRPPGVGLEFGTAAIKKVKTGANPKLAERLITDEAETETSSNRKAAEAAPPPPAGPPADVTSIKNAAVDQQRADRDMPPRPPVDPTGHDYETLAGQAKQIAQQDPGRIDRLVDGLAAKSRPLDDLEDAMLTVRAVELEAAHDRAKQAVIAAEAGGSALDLEDARAAEKDANDRLRKVYEVGTAAGTANARGLAARRMMMNRAFELIPMEMAYRAAGGGAELKPEEAAKVAEFQRQIADLRQQLAEKDRLHRIERLEAANGTLNEQTRDLAAQLLDQDKESIAPRQELYKFAMDALKPFGVDRDMIRKAHAVGRDSASIRGLDEVAGEVQSRWPSLFGEDEQPIDTLFSLLRDVPKPMTRAEAMAKAKERLADQFGDLFGEPPPQAPMKPTRSARVQSARAEVDKAWGDLIALGKGDKLFSVEGAAGEVLTKAAALAKAYVKLGVAHVADFIDRVQERAGVPLDDDQRAKLSQGWDLMKQQESAERRTKLVERLKDKVDDPAAVSRVAKQLHREAALAGVEGLKERVRWVHEALAEVVPGITEGAAADAIGGYGIFKPLPKGKLEEQLRDERGQLQQLAKLKDLEAGLPPKKTGFEQREPSQAERDLIQKVNDRRKELGLQVSDPATQLKSALESAKTRMKNQIEGMADQIAKGEKRERTGSKLQPDEGLRSLTSVRDALKADYDALFGEKGRTLTDEERIDAAARVVERQIADYQKQIDAKDFARKAGKPVNSPALEALKARRDALKAERDTLRDADPSYQEDQRAKELVAGEKRLKDQIAGLTEKIAKGDLSAKQTGEGPPELQGLRDQRDALAKQLQDMRNDARPRKTKEELVNNRLQADYARRIAELKEKLANKDFSEPAKPEPVAKTADTLKLQRELEGVKNEWQQGLDERRRAERPMSEKVAEGVATYVRNAVISSPTTLAKIVGASAWRLATTPAKEAAGAVWSFVLRPIAALAPREGGGLSPKAEFTAAVAGMTTGIKDAWDNLTQGQSELDKAFGKKDAKSAWTEFVGRTHAAMKAPAVRAEFERSLLKRTDAAQANGVDVSHPDNLLRLQLDAYKDANRARFQQENWLVDAYNMGVAAMERSANPVAKTTGTLFRVLNPVVRVPTNIAFEIASHALGVPYGAAELANAFRKGFGKLSPDEADAIMRHFKEGSLGIGLMALGYVNADRFGGGYTGKKRDDGEEPGSAKLFGVTLPSWALHNPTVEMLQYGASVYHAEHAWTKKGGEAGLATGIGQAFADWGQGVPLVGHFSRTVAGVFSPKPEERGYALGEVLKGVAVPQLFQWLAKQLDKPHPFTVESIGEEPQRRSPSGATERIMTGVPVLRSDVPANKPKRRR